MNIFVILEIGSVLNLCPIYALNDIPLCSFSYLGDHFFQVDAGRYSQRKSLISDLHFSVLSMKLYF